MTKRFSFVLVVTNTFLVLSIYGQKPELDSFITHNMQRLHIPGFAAVAINHNEVVWKGYYGFQDLEKKIPVTERTLFMIASTSKTVTAAALMKLYSLGKFHLDDDINQYLDFEVVNPRYPKSPITFRQLLRHRSSISDNYAYLGQFWNINTGDPTIPLNVFLKGYLSSQGAHYDKEKNFYNYAPNAKFNYSNIGFALIGYLVERIAGEPYDKFCKREIFEPLAMNRTSWFLRGVDSTDVAMPYHYSDSLHKYLPYGFGGYPDYPAGELRTSAEQFAHFLLAWTNNGVWDTRQVFDSGAIQTLTPTDFNLGFHTWFLYGTEKGTILYSHMGGDLGVTSFISYNPKDRKGIIFLTNGEIRGPDYFREIINGIYSKVF
jgi:CubicO group peptidase (beta-lactamase class C family)